MSFQLEPFAPIGLDESLLQLLLEEHRHDALPRLERLWSYYRNELAAPDVAGTAAGYPAQASWLPSRLKSSRPPLLERTEEAARDVFIENDIAWRVHTLVDFMFPQPPRIHSQANDPALRERIDAVLEAALQVAGGAGLWHQAALLSSVYGHVDFLVHDGATDIADQPLVDDAAADTQLSALLERVRQLVRIEVIEAPRAIALVNPNDASKLDAMVLHFIRPGQSRRSGPGNASGNTLERLVARFAARNDTSSSEATAQRETVDVTEIWSAAAVQRYENGRLVLSREHRLGRVPFVHIQNQSQPLTWEGLSDVEPLIPLQDELNTRVTDRANRVTMQSFRMWLGKGIDDFTDRPVGPGQMWVTDNLDASIESFGGDAASPSEREHVEQVRAALDKASGVTPAAAGHIQARVGNLTSENALRISLMGTIAKTKRKRITFGQGIESLCAMVLQLLDVHGVLATQPRDRRVEITWSDPLPPDESRRIADARAKAELGIPLETLRAELGY